MSGWIVVASKASGSPYSPAAVVRTATGITPCDLRLIGFLKLPGLMLIATGTILVLVLAMTQLRAGYRLIRWRSSCLILLVAALISGCGSSGTDSKENAAPKYAATPRKALESWVTAVRAGDLEMMCRLLSLRGGCEKAFVETMLLPHVREEMRGLKGDLHYGATGRGPSVVIGVVSGDSPAAYAVKVSRGKTQWKISEESYVPGLAPRIVLEHPDPATLLATGRTVISFLASAYTPGSVYPDAELWIDSRHVNGRLTCPCVDIFPPHEGCSCPTVRGVNPDLETLRWIGAARIPPGQHVMVAAVRSEDAGISANAWVLTVR